MIVSAEQKSKIIQAVVLVVVGVAGRFIPHLWNLTPIAGIAILAGARLGPVYAFVVPVSAMLVSDMFLGFYSWPIMLSVYSSFALSGLIGILIGDTKKVFSIISGSFVSTMIFFLTTNFAVWFFGSMYAKSFFGLTLAYVAGLPFLQNQIIGDMFYTVALFAVWQILSEGTIAYRLKFVR